MQVAGRVQPQQVAEDPAAHAVGLLQAEREGGHGQAVEALRELHALALTTKAPE